MAVEYLLAEPLVSVERSRALAFPLAELLPLALDLVPRSARDLAGAVGLTDPTLQVAQRSLRRSAHHHLWQIFHSRKLSLQPSSLALSSRQQAHRYQV